jgi:hypothetical protein
LSDHGDFPTDFDREIHGFWSGKKKDDWTDILCHKSIPTVAMRTLLRKWIRIGVVRSMNDFSSPFSFVMSFGVGRPFTSLPPGAPPIVSQMHGTPVVEPLIVDLI